jgi:hypothetical protein
MGHVDRGRAGVTSNSVARSQGAGTGGVRRGTRPARERRLSAFEPGVRRTVAALAARAGELEDLAETFPALLHALASGHAPAAAIDGAITGIMAGATLRSTAECIGLPWWTRRLPAGALRRKLVGLPDGEAFGLHIANHVPQNTAACVAWLDRIAYAAEVLGPAFALWVARHLRGTTPAAGQEGMVWLTAWAWHSSRPDTLGHRLMRRPWSSTLGYRRASDEVVVWRGRVAMIGPTTAGTRGCWREAGEAHGYTFVPIEGIEAFVEEAEVMGNCLDQYHAQLEGGTRRVYSIRREGQRIAVLELGPHPTEISAPQILQLRGPRNRSVEEPIWRAAYAWLGGGRARPPSMVMRTTRRTKMQAAQLSFWQPHIAATAGTEHQRALARMLEAHRGRGSRTRTFDATAPVAFTQPIAAHAALDES